MNGPNIDRVNLMVDAYLEVPPANATNKEVAMAVSAVVVSVACNIAEGSDGTLTPREALSHILGMIEEYFTDTHDEPKH